MTAIFPSGKYIVVFDLDGTICNTDHRLPLIAHADPAARDWDAFNAACVDDTPYEDVAQMTRLTDGWGYRNLILTGRSADVTDQTITWLAKYDIWYTWLRMRPSGNYDPDVVCKRRMMSDRELNDVFCVFEDRDGMVNMWRGLGIPCYQTRPGQY